MAPPEGSHRDWLVPVATLAISVVAIRLILLAFDGTDLFVDEAQYWLWGQDFAWGYYSKPPLIAWLIGGVTTLAGSDGHFWVRMPAPVLNGVTAVIIGAISARIWGPRSAIWSTLAYLTLPLVAFGSILISTDTVMAPFYVGALLVYLRLCETRRAGDAALVGVLVGIAFLAKYAAVYFLFGGLLAALVLPKARIGWRNTGLLLLAFAVVVAPNLLWNVQNGLVTLKHTADNIGWVNKGIDATHAPGLEGLAIFVASQFGVVGPVIFGAFLIGLWRNRRYGPLAAFALVPLAAVSVQSLLDRANANWAAAAYFVGIPLAMAVLAKRPWLRAFGLGLNVVVAVALPLLAVWPDTRLWQDHPILDRYTGQAALSREIIALAKAQPGVPIFAENRDVLADLFYTGRDDQLTIYAPPNNGRPQSYYEVRYPLPAAITGPVLAIRTETTGCPDLAPPVPLGSSNFNAFLVDATCLSQTPDYSSR